MLRKALLAGSVAALAAMPAWALPAQAHSNHASDHAQTAPQNPSGTHGKSHKCKPHKVAYVAVGTLVSQTLAQDAGASTYSGDVVVNVTRTNRHGRADKGQQVTYTLTHARITFGLADTNNDGTVGLDDLAAGDRVRAIGKITTLAKKCDKSNFTAETTIRKVVFHAPATTPDSQDQQQQS
jgi:hypothetical protein